jgi:hypothetical protein
MPIRIRIPKMMRMWIRNTGTLDMRSKSVLRIQDVYQGTQIPDPTFYHLGSGSATLPQNFWVGSGLVCTGREVGGGEFIQFNS